MSSFFIAVLLMISAAAVIYTFTKAKKPVLTAFKSALCGIAALLTVNVTSAATGCYIAVNFLTVSVATFMSLPGVIALVICNILFV